MEKYFLALAEIPRLELRLKCMDTLHTFQTQFDEIENDVNTLLAAVKAVSESGKFKEWLTLILATGNYMNGKSKHGCAFGFDLKTLEKLPGTKSTSKPPVSLLEWLVEFVKETMKRDDMIEIDKDWKVLGPVRTVILSEIEKNIGLLQAKLQLCESQSAEERAPSDRFNEVVKPFVIKSRKSLQTLETKHKAATRMFTDLYTCYGISPKDMNDNGIKEFWDRLKEFADNITKVGGVECVWAGRGWLEWSGWVAVLRCRGVGAHTHSLAVSLTR